MYFQNIVEGKTQFELPTMTPFHILLREITDNFWQVFTLNHRVFNCIDLWSQNEAGFCSEQLLFSKVISFVC